jgi:stearoyl-CoA desaturase (delta-9 desaturase)
VAAEGRDHLVHDLRQLCPEDGRELAIRLHLEESYKSMPRTSEKRGRNGQTISPESKHMTTVARRVNMAAVIVPFAAFVAAVAFLPASLVGWQDLAILAVMYVACGLGVTVGYHRLLTHRSFATYKPVEYLFAVLGSMAVQGPVIAWVADHRKHHAHADEEGDPHSPHVGHGGGLRGTLRGLWHAHVGWLFHEHGTAAYGRYARDLMEDPGMKFINRMFLPLVGLSLLIPFALGWGLTGEVSGALTALFWGGFVRLFFVHHVTWSVNSICHFFGRRRFETDDESRNVFWLALPSLGESWHHNHHAFPRSAVHGLRWWELDVSGWIIRAMRRLGLAWNVVLIPPERQQAKMAGAGSEPRLRASV